MACVRSFRCKNCGEDVYEVADSSGVCCACRTGLAKIAEDAHMAKLAILPLEERIRRIELLLYRLDAEKRLRILESSINRISY